MGQTPRKPTPTKKPAKAVEQMTDAEIAQRVFGKQLKCELDRVIEDSNKKAPPLIDS